MSRADDIWLVFQTRIPSTIAVSAFPRDRWDATLDTVHAPYGWRPIDANAGTLLTVCVEIIAEQCDHLTDDELSTYLSWIVLHTTMHHTRLERAAWDGLDRDQLEARIEDLCHDVAPGAGLLVNDIRLAVLG